MGLCLLGHSSRTGMFGGIMAATTMGIGASGAFGAAELGVVFLQTRCDPRLAEVGLAALAAGGDAAVAVQAMRVVSGAKSRWRQFTVLDARGGVAGFCGEQCPPPRGEALGPGCIASGHAAASDRVLLEMVEVFAGETVAALPDSLIAALEAGCALERPVLPMQSACLKVFRPGLPFPWVDLRVDWSPAPLDELATLWSLWAPMADAAAAGAIDPARAAAAGQAGERLETPPRSVMAR